LRGALARGNPSFLSKQVGLLRCLLRKLPRNDSASSGFTLVELSIVLVIIGLIVGGVLAGQSLVQAAKVTRVVSEFKKYQAAINMFRDKYDAWPGDMPNATSYWSNTVNGNGDNVVAFFGGVETLRAWQQLSLAEMVEGKYTGVYDSVLPWWKPKLNLAPSAMESGVFHIRGDRALEGSTATFNHLLFSASISAAFAEEAILIPSDAFNIDTKMDDGIPTTGKIRTLDLSGCRASNTAYAVSQTKKLCALGYKLE
jgi:prepilin-type N-terminal cleavage/methylation domain-containing protein